MMIGLLWVLCAIDGAMGLWFASVLVAAVREYGAARLLTAESAGFVAATVVLLAVPLACWLLRARTSLATRLVIAAVPLAVLVATGKIWVSVR